MEKENIKTLADLYTYWADRGIERTHCIKEMLEEYNPECEYLDPHTLGDLQEIASMRPSETQAFFAMAYSFNALWNLTFNDEIRKGSHLQTNWVNGDGWRKVYAYWAKKYPNAYHTVEIWVFG